MAYRITEDASAAAFVCRNAPTKPFGSATANFGFDSDVARNVWTIPKGRIAAGSVRSRERSSSMSTAPSRGKGSFSR